MDNQLANIVKEAINKFPVGIVVNPNIYQMLSDYIPTENNFHQKINSFNGIIIVLHPKQIQDCVGFHSLEDMNKYLDYINLF